MHFFKGNVGELKFHRVNLLYKKTTSIIKLCLLSEMANIWSVGPSTRDGLSPRAGSTQLESSQYKCSGSNFAQLSSTRECIDSAQLELDPPAR